MLITDAMAAAGVGDGRYRLGRLDVDVRDGMATLAEGGSLAGSTLTMDAAYRNAVAAGLDDVVASRAASANPARLLGIDDEVGTIEVGKRADLVVLDDAAEVVAVIAAGEVVSGSLDTVLMPSIWGRSVSPDLWGRSRARRLIHRFPQTMCRVGRGQPRVVGETPAPRRRAAPLRSSWGSVTLEPMTATIARQAEPLPRGPSRPPSPPVPKPPSRSTAAAAPKSVPSTVSPSACPPTASPRSWARRDRARAR